MQPVALRVRELTGKREEVVMTKSIRVTAKPKADVDIDALVRAILSLAADLARNTDPDAAQTKEEAGPPREAA
jgi:hypothetical protein